MVVKLNLLSHTNHVKILVRIDLNLIENNNQRRKEVVLRYHLKRHNVRHIENVRQEKEGKRLKQQRNCLLKVKRRL